MVRDRWASLLLDLAWIRHNISFNPFRLGQICLHHGQPHDHCTTSCPDHPKPLRNEYGRLGRPRELSAEDAQDDDGCGLPSMARLRSRRLAVPSYSSSVSENTPSQSPKDTEASSRL